MDKLKLKFRKSTFESEQFFRLLGNLILHLFWLFRFQFQIIQKLSPYLNRLFRSKKFQKFNFSNQIETTQFKREGSPLVQSSPFNHRNSWIFLEGGGRGGGCITWDQAQFSFRFANNILAGKAKQKFVAVAVRENVWEPLKLCLISGKGWEGGLVSSFW